MFQIKEIRKINKAILMAGTSLALAGCGTAAQQNYADSSVEGTPVAATEQKSEPGDLSLERLMRIANRAWLKGNIQTALRVYTLASQKAPESTAPLLAVAEILRKTKRTDAALDLYQQIIRKNPQLVAAHTGFGYTLLAQDKPYLAAKSFEIAVGLDRTNAKSLGGLALALDTAGESEKAQSYYRLAIKADTNNLTYQNNLALSLALIGRTDQAIAMLEIITAHPNATAQHRQNLALVYGMAGKSADAMRYSRMDLSESAARNNALYFQALNNPSEGKSTIAEDQSYKMAAKARDAKRYRAPDTSRQPYTYIAASNETVALNTQPVIDEPAQIIASRPSTVRPLTTARQPYSIINTAKPPAKLPMVRPAEQALALVSKMKPASSHMQIRRPVPAYRSSMQYAQAPLEVRDVMAIRNTGPAKEQPRLAEQPAALPVKADLRKDDVSRPQNADPVSFETGQALYYVQLASFRTIERAQLGWNLLSKQYGDLLTGFKPVYVKADLGEDKGVYYRVRIGGFTNKAVPDEICSGLKTRDAECYLPRIKAQSPLDGSVITTADPANDQKVIEAVLQQKEQAKPVKSTISFDGQVTAQAGSY